METFQSSPPQQPTATTEADYGEYDDAALFIYERPWLYPKQLKAIFEPVDFEGRPARYSLIEASTKTGKTVGCIMWLFEQAYLGRSGWNFWWVAPIYGQAKIAFRRMKKALPSEIFVANEGELTITLLNGAVIWFKGADNPDSLYGEDVYAAVIDEASRAKEAAWHALRSTLTFTGGPVRFIGNVKGRRNWFFALCRRAEQGEQNLAYTKIVAYDAVAAGILRAAEIEDAKRTLPDAVFRELYLAEPSDDQGNPFGIKAIEGCLVPALSTKPVVSWGWDLGKDVDWTVGCGLDVDGHLAKFERWQRPWQQCIPDIRRITGRTPALVDSTGLGDPVLAILQDNGGSNFEGYKFTQPSKQMLMEGLAVAIQQKDVAYPDGILRQELDTFEYEYTKSGVKYTAPEGFHDDCVCSLALAVQHKGKNKGAALWARLGAQAKAQARKAA
jgi:hypothetical protein